MTWFVSAVIVLVMCFPCMDSPRPTVVQSASYQTTTSNQDHAAVQDGCSPFCTCACCSIPTFVQNNTVAIVAPEPLAIEYSQKAFGKATDAELSVWQPPRLG